MSQQERTSRAIVVPRRGGPERLTMQAVSVPPPGPGEVRVRMLATGVAFADLMIREGVYPIELPWPRTPGYDIVGEIEAVGPGVPEAMTVGTRVAALTVHGDQAVEADTDAAEDPTRSALDPSGPPGERAVGDQGRDLRRQGVDALDPEGVLRGGRDYRRRPVHAAAQERLEVGLYPGAAAGVGPCDD